MISIVTQTGIRDAQMSSRDRFIQTANEFLRQNGVQTDTGLYLDKDLYFKADCSNPEYTRAFALLLLLSSFHESNFHCNLRLNDKTPRITVDVRDYEKAEAWIFSNMKVKVQAKDRGKVKGKEYNF